jgi:hypothetical protein
MTDQSETTPEEPATRYDLRSKFIDGVLATAILYLLTLTLFLLIRPFQTLMGKSGIFSYTIGIIALAIFCLEHSMVTRISEPHRAWYGMTGGVMTWIVIEAVYMLGDTNMISESSIVTLLMVGLIIGTLWRRRIFSVGLKFYTATLILGYSVHLGVDALRYVVNLFPAMSLVLDGTGIFAIVCLFAVCGWLFFRTEWRIQRLWCALWMWCFLLISLYVFSGGVV